MPRSLRALSLLVPAALVLAGCGNASEVGIGEPVDVSNGTLTVTEVVQGSAADIAELELDELQQHTPWFVRYQVAFEEGTAEEDQRVATNLWGGDASAGEVAPVEVYQVGDQFDCTGLEEVAGGQAQGCQLVMVEPGATLEAVEYGGAGRWPVSGS